MIKTILALLRKTKPCRHLFRACDMQPRDEKGMVHWDCFKCGKEFIEPCGLDVLSHGDCDGRWGKPTIIKSRLTNGDADATHGIPKR